METHTLTLAIGRAGNAFVVWQVLTSDARREDLAGRGNAGFYGATPDGTGCVVQIFPPSLHWTHAEGWSVIITNADETRKTDRAVGSRTAIMLVDLTGETATSFDGVGPA